MSKKYRHYKRFMALMTGGALLGLCQSAMASGFQLQEQNVTNLGTAYAGTAALAEDASTGFYNPAGLSRLDNEQVVISGVWISPRSQLTTTNATSIFGTSIGSGTTKAHGDTIVPALHYSNRINECWAFGFNVTSPYGLKNNYANNSIARYMATRSELRTADLSPSIAYDFRNGLSIGVGFDALYGIAKLDTRVNPAIPPALPLAVNDGFSENTGNAFGYGYHVGALYAFKDCARIGVHYRSQVKLRLRGDQLFQAAFNAPQSIQGVKADITLPDTAVLSAYVALNDQWALMADLQWTHWNKFNKLILRYDSGILLTTTENFKDSYRVALGGSYQVDDCLRLRLGVAWDKSPVRDQYRTIRIPDTNRTWAAFGAQYRFNKCVALEFGYAHIFFKKANINEGPAVVSGLPGAFQTRNTLQGNVKTRADLVGLQLTWDII